MAAGAEAVAIVQLIDACIGITNTIIAIGKAVKDAQGLPPSLKELWEKVPAISELLSEASEKCDQGKVSASACDSAKPVLEQCKKALDELRVIFRKACPEDDDNTRQRLWKGTRTIFIGRESKVKKLLVTVQDNLRLLEQKEIYHIGDRLDELQQATEALSHDEGEGSKYMNVGPGNLFANDGGSPENNVLGDNSRLVKNSGTYNEHANSA